MENKLLNRNFIMVVIGQIISIFGNVMLRFALPLYILQETGSAIIFGSILAIAMIPTIILSPIGGILADRFNKKWIMVILDFITTIIILLFAVMIDELDNIVFYIGIVLILLSIIQSFYQPTVQSSIPLIVPSDKILEGNAIVSLVNSTSNLIGPILGGILYAIVGLKVLVYVSGLCFFLAAIMEIFIYISHTKQPSSGNVFKTIKSDIKESLTYIFIDNKIIANALFIVAGINLVLSAMIIVGYPIFITIDLKLSAQYYGIAQGIMAAGAIAGGLSVGVISKKLKLSQYYILLLITSIFLIPNSFIYILKLSTMTSFIILCISGFIMMFVSTLFSIRLMSFMQKETPQYLLAKVISYALTLCMCALPLGQLIYGFLFNNYSDSKQYIIIGGAIISIIVSLYAKKTFMDLKDE